MTATQTEQDTDLLSELAEEIAIASRQHHLADVRRVEALQSQQGHHQAALDAARGGLRWWAAELRGAIRAHLGELHALARLRGRGDALGQLMTEHGEHLAEVLLDANHSLTAVVAELVAHDNNAPGAVRAAYANLATARAACGESAEALHMADRQVKALTDSPDYARWVRLETPKEGEAEVTPADAEEAFAAELIRLAQDHLPRLRDLDAGWPEGKTPDAATGLVGAPMPLSYPLPPPTAQDRRRTALARIRQAEGEAVGELVKQALLRRGLPCE